MGRFTELSTMVSMTSPDPGIPAVPIEARVAVSMIITCWVKVSSTPKIWAVNTTATAS